MKLANNSKCSNGFQPLVFGPKKPDEPDKTVAAPNGARHLSFQTSQPEKHRVGAASLDVAASEVLNVGVAEAQAPH